MRAMASSDDASSGIVMPLDCTLSSLACSRTGTETATDGTEASQSSLKHMAKIEEFAAVTRGRSREGPLSAASAQGYSNDDDAKSGDSFRSRSDGEAQSVPGETRGKAVMREHTTPRGSRQERASKRPGPGRRMPHSVNEVEMTP